MTPRVEYDEDFADFELLDEGAFDYSGRKPASATEPTKTTIAVIQKKAVAVPSTPIATDVEKVKDAITELQVKVLDTSADTVVQFQKVQTVLDSFGRRFEEQRTTQDRRMRTLEYCFDDYEMDMKKCTDSITLLKNQFETLQAALGKVDVADLHRISKETAVRSVETSSRLDSIVGHHLSSIEQKIRAIYSTQKEHDFTSHELRRTVSELRIQLADLTEMNVADVRQIAENADLPSKVVQSSFCHLLKDLIPVLEDKIHELTYTATKAFKNCTATIAAISNQVNALRTDQASCREAMAADVEDLAFVDSRLIDETFKSKNRLDDVEKAIKTLFSDGKAMVVDVQNIAKVVDSFKETDDTNHRVARAEEVIQRLVGKVLPLLEFRVQEQQELLEIAEKTAAVENARSAEREEMLFKRIERLEEKTSRGDIGCRQIQLESRVNSLEKTLNELAGEVKQTRLPERKVQLHPSVAAALTSIDDCTPPEVAKEIEVECSDIVAPPKPTNSITIQC